MNIFAKSRGILATSGISAWLLLIAPGSLSQGAAAQTLQEAITHHHNLVGFGLLGPNASERAMVLDLDDKDKTVLGKPLLPWLRGARSIKRATSRLASKILQRAPWFGGGITLYLTHHCTNSTYRGV